MPCQGRVYYLKSPGTKWQIAKYIDGGEAHYVLFEGNARHPPTKFYDSAKEAMDVADELMNRQGPQ